MARKCFYSFHFEPDNWRASQVRNMGMIEGNQPVSDNDWEAVKRGGDGAIEKWISDHMYGRSCTVVLIGTSTAGRKWINHEITKTWKDGKGLVGIYIHGLKDKTGLESFQGSNPFAGFNLDGTPFNQIVKAHNPPYTASTDVYRYINDNLERWVEDAVALRAKY